MKIIYNNYIPFNGFKAINLFGIVFARRKLSQKDIKHELIHTKQMKKYFYIGFYILYILEYIKNLFVYKFNTKAAYKNISFEKEAYANS